MFLKFFERNFGSPVEITLVDPSGRSVDAFVGSNPAGDMDVSCECCVLSGKGVCVGLITHPEESYRVWRVWLSVAPWLEVRGFEILYKREHYFLSNTVWYATYSVLVCILKSSIMYSLWKCNFSIFYRGPNRRIRTLASMKVPTAVKSVCVQLLQVPGCK